VRYVVTEKFGKNDAHYKKRKKRREDAPEHAEIGALVFLFEVTLYELSKEEAMLLHSVHEAVFVSFFRHNVSSNVLLNHSITHSRKKVKNLAVKLTFGFIFAKRGINITGGKYAGKRKLLFTF
jgi:hypothetical protein